MSLPSKEHNLGKGASPLTRLSPGGPPAGKLTPEDPGQSGGDCRPQRWRRVRVGAARAWKRRAHPPLEAGARLASQSSGGTPGRAEATSVSLLWYLAAVFLLR